MSRQLMNYLPQAFQGLVEFDVTMNAEQAEIDEITGAIEQIIVQAYPQEATWALERFENDLGIVPEFGKPIDQRRSVVLSKMRGGTKVSVSMLYALAKLYDYGDLDITVLPDEFRINFKFISMLGMPENIEDLQAMLTELAPGHLEVNFEFRFFTWRDLQASGLTWDELSALRLTWDQLLNEGVSGGGANPPEINSNAFDDFSIGWVIVDSPSGNGEISLNETEINETGSRGIRMATGDKNHAYCIVSKTFDKLYSSVRLSMRFYAAVARGLIGQIRITASGKSIQINQWSQGWNTVNFDATFDMLEVQFMGQPGHNDVLVLDSIQYQEEDKNVNNLL